MSCKPYCNNVSPVDKQTQCTLEPGHSDIHRNGYRAWPSIATVAHGEHFRDIPRIIKNGGGDDNVTSWRAAELNLTCSKCHRTNPARGWGRNGMCYECTYGYADTPTVDNGIASTAAAIVNKRALASAERAFKFLCHLDLQHHPVDEQRELLAIVRELKTVLGRGEG